MPLTRTMRSDRLVSESATEPLLGANPGGVFVAIAGRLLPG